MVWLESPASAVEVVGAGDGGSAEQVVAAVGRHVLWLSKNFEEALFVAAAVVQSFVHSQEDKCGQRRQRSHYVEAKTRGGGGASLLILLSE